jgi:mRNA interferase MazF
VGGCKVKRGEIRWYTFSPPDKRRPVLIISRDEVSNILNELIVVPVTTTIRGISTEIILTSSDGMPKICALNFDHISLARKDRLGPVISSLRDERWPSVRECILVATGFEGLL